MKTYEIFEILRNLFFNLDSLNDNDKKTLLRKIDLYQEQEFKKLKGEYIRIEDLPF